MPCARPTEVRSPTQVVLRLLLPMGERQIIGHCERFGELGILLRPCGELLTRRLQPGGHDGARCPIAPEVHHDGIVDVAILLHWRADGTDNDCEEMICSKRFAESSSSFAPCSK